MVQQNKLWSHKMSYVWYLGLKIHEKKNKSLDSINFEYIISLLDELRYSVERIYIIDTEIV